VIVVNVPGRGDVTWDGSRDDVTVAIDPDIEMTLLDAGVRGQRTLRELTDSFRADVDRVLAGQAYGPDGDVPWRLIPGRAEHARAALLSLPGAALVDDTEAEVEATILAVLDDWREHVPDHL
jgi:hypothetical protein